MFLSFECFLFRVKSPSLLEIVDSLGLSKVPLQVLRCLPPQKVNQSGIRVLVETFRQIACHDIGGAGSSPPGRTEMMALFVV